MIEAFDAIDDTEAEGRVDDGPIDGDEKEDGESDDEPSLGASEYPSAGLEKLRQW